MGLSINYFKIHGLTLGFQYIDGRVEEFELDDNVRAIQLYLFVIGFTIEWYR